MRSMEVLGDGSMSLRAPDYVDCRVLAANTAEQHTVPAGATRVIFSATANFYAAYGANPTAVVPSGDVTDGTSNELNPTIRLLGVAKISLISAETCIVTMAFYV